MLTFCLLSGYDDEMKRVDVTTLSSQVMMVIDRTCCHKQISPTLLGLRDRSMASVVHIWARSEAIFP